MCTNVTLCASPAAFLFNWIGFLLLLCFCHSVAGRYGALAGFGLSLAKWTLIVKNSTTLVSHDNSWLWWLIMAFGESERRQWVGQKVGCCYSHVSAGWIRGDGRGWCIVTGQPSVSPA